MYRSNLMNFYFSGKLVYVDTLYGGYSQFAWALTLAAPRNLAFQQRYNRVKSRGRTRDEAVIGRSIR